MGAEQSTDTTLADNYLKFHGLKNDYVENILNNKVIQNDFEDFDLTLFENNDLVEIRRYYFDKQNYFEVKEMNQNYQISFIKDQNILFKRKAVFRYLSYILNECNNVEKKIFLKLKKPVSINTLLAISCLNYFLKISQEEDEYMCFEIFKKKPVYLTRVEAHQFKTILENGKFYMSQYSLKLNTFEFREQTSYRYREALYLKKKNYLNFVLLTPDKLNKLLKLQFSKTTTIIIKYKMFNSFFYFIGHPNNVIQKLNALSTEQQTKFLQNCFVHDFIFSRKETINDILSKSPIAHLQSFDIDTATVLHESSELVLKKFSMLNLMLNKNIVSKKIKQLKAVYKNISNTEAFIKILKNLAENLYLKDESK